MSKADRRARKQANKERAQQQRYAAWRRQRRHRILARVTAVALVAALVGGVSAAVFGGGGDSSTAPTVTTGPESTTTLPPELAAVECSEEVPETAGEEKPAFAEPPEVVIDPERTYRASIETSCGAVVVEMDPTADGVSEAGVNNFVFLAREGFYDGLTFHRVVADFVIQGGDPSGDGTGGPGYQFGEADDVPEGITYEIGDLAYANSGATETSGSQFFVITGEEGRALSTQATFIKFGTVIEGLEVAQRIEAFETPGTQAPGRPVFITSVTIEEV